VTSARFIGIDCVLAFLVLDVETVDDSLRFGVVLHLSGRKADWSSFVSFARKAEALGYDSVWVTDHLMSPTGIHKAFEAWTVLSALSQVTSRIRLGTYVLCNQFRHPSMLARMVASLDKICEGRLDLGIGAGWFREEHLTFGLNWHPHSIRIERLGETLEAIRRLWTEDNVTYDGECVHLRNVTLDPKPTQKPHPPIWVGGGSLAILKTVARHGDGWIPSLPSLEQLSEGVSFIEKEMVSIGRQPERLQVAYGGSGCLIITKDQSEVGKMRRSLLQSSGKSSNLSNCIIGTPDQCVERIKEYGEAGADMIVSGFYDFPLTKGLNLFAETVIPYFKGR